MGNQTLLGRGKGGHSCCVAAAVPALPLCLRRCWLWGRDASATSKLLWQQAGGGGECVRGGVCVRVCAVCCVRVWWRRRPPPHPVAASAVAGQTHNTVHK
eukprot:1563983-Pyramimonas_sp.AAC.1